MEIQLWELTEGECTTPGAEGLPTFGVTVRCPDGGVWQWPDVDPDRRVVQALLERLQTIQPEPCHFADVVLDYIHEVAGQPD